MLSSFSYGGLRKLCSLYKNAMWWKMENLRKASKIPLRIVRVALFSSSTLFLLSLVLFFARKHSNFKKLNIYNVYVIIFRCGRQIILWKIVKQTLSTLHVLLFLVIQKIEYYVQCSNKTAKEGSGYCIKFVVLIWQLWQE